MAETVESINCICAHVTTGLLLQSLMVVTEWCSNATNFMCQKIDISWLIGSVVDVRTESCVGDVANFLLQTEHQDSGIEEL